MAFACLAIDRSGNILTRCSVDRRSRCRSSGGRCLFANWLLIPLIIHQYLLREGCIQTLDVAAHIRITVNLRSPLAPLLSYHVPYAIQHVDNGLSPDISEPGVV